MKKINEKLLHAYVLAEREPWGTSVEKLKAEVLMGQRNVRRWMQLLIVSPFIVTMLLFIINDGLTRLFVGFLGVVIYLGFAFIGTTEPPLDAKLWNKWIKLFKEFEKYFFVHNSSYGPSWIYDPHEATHDFLREKTEGVLSKQAKAVVSLENKGDLDSRYQCVAERDKLKEMHCVARELGLANQKIEVYFPMQAS